MAFVSELRAVLSGSGVLDGELSAPEPRELAAAAKASVAIEPFGGFVVRPRASAELRLSIDDGDAAWSLAGGLGLEAKPTPRAGAALAADWAVDSDENSGPVGRASLEWTPAGNVALRARGIFRGFLDGPGVEASAADPYRSAAIAGRADARLLAGAESAWIARPLELSFGELVIIERPELGAYLDLSGARPASGGELETRLTLGGTLSAGFSVMGLAPIVVSAFAGAATDGSGWVLGLRAGRFF
jgi:hypothetical protein